MRKIAGSILVGFGLIAAVLNGWMRHFFYTQYNIAKGMMLQGGGSFSAPSIYANPETVNIFIGTRLAIWFVIILGVVLIISGLKTKKYKKK